MFNPTEIIFSSTTACNLSCAHCFVNRVPKKIEIQDALSLLNSIKKSDSNIDKIGFSGGEPFLYLEFILEITKAAVEMDFMFDQIMTNGDWWQDETELKDTLQKLYNAGYDGKIGLSWDNFHGQKTERMLTFIKYVKDFFGEDSINIQTVKAQNQDSSIPEILQSELPVFILPQSFPSSDSRAWQSKKWFKDDYCEGPGQILYVHADGNIAPCCGFANENKELFIGNIKQDFNTIIKQASENEMIKICYETGLGKYKKQLKKNLKKQGKKIPGKCNDICSFCDYVCRNLEV